MNQKREVFRTGPMIRLPNGDFVSQSAFRPTLNHLTYFSETQQYWPIMAELYDVCAEKKEVLSPEGKELLTQFGLLIPTCADIPDAVYFLVRNAIEIVRDPTSGEVEFIRVLTEQELLPPKK